MFQRRGYLEIVCEKVLGGLRMVAGPFHRLLDYFVPLTGAYMDGRICVKQAYKINRVHLTLPQSGYFGMLIVVLIASVYIHRSVYYLLEAVERF